MKFKERFKADHQIIKDTYKRAKMHIKHNRLRTISFSIMRILLALIGVSLMYVEIEKIMQNLFYGYTMPNYHVPINYLSLGVGFLVTFGVLAISKIYTQAYLMDDNHERASDYVSQFSSTLSALTLLSYLFELIWAGIGIGIVTLINATIDPYSDLWSTLQIITIVVYIVFALVLWSYLQLFIPISYYKTFGTGQTIRYSFTFWRKHILILTLYAVKFILWDIFEIFTMDLASVYVYPLKLNTISYLVKDQLQTKKGKGQTLNENI